MPMLPIPTTGAVLTPATGATLVLAGVPPVPPGVPGAACVASEPATVVPGTFEGVAVVVGVVGVLSVAPGPAGVVAVPLVPTGAAPAAGAAPAVGSVPGVEIAGPPAGVDGGNADTPPRMRARSFSISVKD